MPIKVSNRSLGPQFRWLWTAFAVSTFGTWLAFEAFPLIAILILHAGPSQVSLLKSAGLAVGAIIAIPLGPWLEFRQKRPVMVAMDLIRFAAMLSIPVAFALGWLSFLHLLVVSIIGGAADITFRAASGAYLKALVPSEDLLIANGRFESTSWTAIAVGPPLGGLAIGLFGPVITVVADAISYLLSALGIYAIRGDERSDSSVEASFRFQTRDVLYGWKYILSHPALRPLFLNSLFVNGLIMATSPLVAFLMLGRLGFKPWQYGIAFGVPCVGGLLGARLAPPLVAQFGKYRILFAAGALRACWSLGLAFIRPGTSGMALVIAVQLGVVTCAGMFNPIFATYRLEQISTNKIARVLSAWSITSNATTAILTALWGLLASMTSARTAIAIAGVLLLATPVLLPKTGLFFTNKSPYFTEQREN